MEIDFLIDEDNLLERVDEYTLYCSYLEYEPEIRVNYNSPLRNNDCSPSFAIYPCKKANREFMWKDSGDKGDSGDIFKLVQRLFGYSTRSEALARIKSDYNLGLKVPATEKVVRNIAKHRSDSDIRVRARDFRPEDLKWWQQFNINETLLKQYRTSPLFYYWLNPSQRTPVFAGPLSFVYRVYDRYQLYFPTREKGKKFRMDMQDHHVHGVEQLTYQTDTLIITKSRKDVMCLRSFGYDAVSPRSENTPMPETFFSWADKHYKRKLVLFDNDMKHRGEWYPYPQIYVPKLPSITNPGESVKDISDFNRDYHPQATAELMRKLVA